MLAIYAATGGKQPPSGSVLTPRVDQRGDRIDQRIKDEQDPCTDRQAGRQRA